MNIQREVVRLIQAHSQDIIEISVKAGVKICEMVYDEYKERKERSKR